MNRYVIDFETTFSKENTLTTKSIEAYVRDPKFEVIGCGIIGTKIYQSYWYDAETFKNWANSLADCAVVCHHAQFDLFILNHVYNVRPAYIFDTLSMSRALYPRLPKHSLEYLVEYLALGQPKSVPYNLFRGKTLAQIQATPGLEQQIAAGCLHDVELTTNLFKLLHPQMPASELDLIDATVRLFTEPKLIGDMEVLEDCLEQAIYERENWPAKLGIDKSVLLSDRKFATLLRGHAVEPPTKISPRTGKTTFALAKSDKAFTDLREHDDEKVRNIVEARLAVKTSIRETRAARLLDASGRGPIPVYLGYYRAHTGRFGGGDKLNLQNPPRNSKLKQGLRAPDGHTLTWADFSQIEARILACLSGCTKLRDAFASGRDIYSEFATNLFRTRVSKTENVHLRYLSKKVILGGGYGAGEDKTISVIRQEIANDPTLADFDISDDMIRKAHKGYRAEYREIPVLWKQFDTLLSQCKENITVSAPKFYDRYNLLTFHKQKIFLPNGLFLDYTGIEHDGQFYRIGKQKLWGGAITENICQALARIIMTDAWLGINYELGPQGKIVLTVHDELIACVSDNMLDYAISTMEDWMTCSPKWMPDLPLAVEIKLGTHYGQESA